MLKVDNTIMKKFKFYIVFFLVVLGISVCGIALGVGFAKIQERHPEYLSAGLMKGIIIFFIAQLISMYLHEIVHVIAYKLQGVGIRMLYLFPLCIVKEESRLKFRFAFNLQIGFGGIVIPKLPIINNDTEYNDFRNKMSVSVFCAPLFSALLGLIFFILVCSTSEHINYDIRSYYFLFCIAMVLWSIYINAMSVLDTGAIVGDYLGAKKMKMDEVYSLFQIYNYFLLQENNEKSEVRFKQNYLINRMFEEVKELSLDNTINIMLADSLLYELILSQKKCNMNIAEPEMINDIVHNLQERLQFETYSCFFSHAIIYLSICGKIDEAQKLWEKYKMRIAKTKTGNYRYKQVELFLYGKKSNDLYTSDDIEISSMDSLLSKVNNYYEDEIYINNLSMNHLN